MQWAWLAREPDIAWIPVILALTLPEGLRAVRHLAAPVNLLGWNVSHKEKKMEWRQDPQSQATVCSVSITGRSLARGWAPTPPWPNHRSCRTVCKVFRSRNSGAGQMC